MWQVEDSHILPETIHTNSSKSMDCEAMLLTRRREIEKQLELLDADLQQCWESKLNKIQNESFDSTAEWKRKAAMKEWTRKATELKEQLKAMKHRADAGPQPSSKIIPDEFKKKLIRTNPIVLSMILHRSESAVSVKVSITSDGVLIEGKLPRKLYAFTEILQIRTENLPAFGGNPDKQCCMLVNVGEDIFGLETQTPEDRSIFLKAMEQRQESGTKISSVNDTVLSMVLHRSESTFPVMVTINSYGVLIEGSLFPTMYTFAQIQEIKTEDLPPFKGTPNVLCCIFMNMGDDQFGLETQTPEDRSTFLNAVNVKLASRRSSIVKGHHSINHGDVNKATSMALMPNKKRLLDEDEQEMNQIESELLQERQSLAQRMSIIDADLKRSVELKASSSTPNKYGGNTIGTSHDTSRRPSTSGQRKMLEMRRSMKQRLSLIDGDLKRCEETKKDIRNSFRKLEKQESLAQRMSRIDENLERYKERQADMSNSQRVSKSSSVHGGDLESHGATGTDGENPYGGEPSLYGRDPRSLVPDACIFGLETRTPEDRRIFIRVMQNRIETGLEVRSNDITLPMTFHQADSTSPVAVSITLQGLLIKGKLFREVYPIADILGLQIVNLPPFQGNPDNLCCMLLIVRGRRGQKGGPNLDGSHGGGQTLDGSGADISVECAAAQLMIKRKNRVIKEAHQLLMQAGCILESELEKSSVNGGRKFCCSPNENKPYSIPKGKQKSRRNSSPLEKAKYVTEVRKALSTTDWFKFKNLMHEVNDFLRNVDRQNANPADRQLFADTVAREVRDIFEDEKYPQKSNQLMRKFELLIPEEEDAELFREKLNPVSKAEQSRAKYVMKVRKVLSPKDWHRFKSIMKEVAEFQREADAYGGAINYEHRRSFVDGVARAMLHIFAYDKYSQINEHLVRDFVQLIPHKDDVLLYHEQLEYNRKLQILLKQAKTENQEIVRLESRIQSQGVPIIKMRLLPQESNGLPEESKNVQADFKQSQRVPSMTVIRNQGLSNGLLKENQQHFNEIQVSQRKSGSFSKQQMKRGDVERVPSMAQIPRQQTIETKQYRNSLERKRATMMFLMDKATESEIES